ncbi:hypothetical protein BgAZ_104590 [Babesia gibsoni]|uniref:Uncharacterized protein n=1 Tax=Babesia gibsoni TaxID=33632 RepID=A0AAD8UVG0_BABGI|nr:hypothetical protein BgAZ_104590 [Babesia gibsoni]
MSDTALPVLVILDYLCPHHWVRRLQLRYIDEYDYHFGKLTTTDHVASFDIGSNPSTDDMILNALSDGMSCVELAIISLGESTYVTDHEMKTIVTDYHAESYVRSSMFDKGLFYKLQAEILVNKRRYRDALAAALIADELLGVSKVTDAIKMICMYQLNDDARFRQLKEKLLVCGFQGLSESLKKQAIGTVQVSNFIPEFIGYVDRAKAKK